MHGVEEPEPEPELTDDTTLESVSGESGADSSSAPCEEKRESLTLGGLKLPPAPVFVFNPDLLHTVKPVSLTLPSSSLSVANTPLLRTPARTPIPTRPTTPIPVQLKKPKRMLLPPALQERKVDGRVDAEYALAHRSLVAPAEIEDVFPVGEVVRKVYD